jgi:hypothetical protein
MPTRYGGKAFLEGMFRTCHIHVALFEEQYREELRKKKRGRSAACLCVVNLGLGLCWYSFSCCLFFCYFLTLIVFFTPL